jgi:hypothetical protein
MVKELKSKFDFININQFFVFSGLANRGLGNLETAHDEKVDAAVKMQALEEGNQFYSECNFYSLSIYLEIYFLFFLSN